MARKDMNKEPHQDKPGKTNNKTQITNNIQKPKHKFKYMILNCQSFFPNQTGVFLADS
jgi:hypothetical protein